MEIVSWKKAKHSFVVNIETFSDQSKFFSFSYSGNYNEQLRITDFPVYISGANGSNMTRLV